jgi:23S rRNA pseudouridine955/2504/2580 synthase/23S rRNA pseudouridine1911/1915/1917 synthase
VHVQSLGHSLVGDPLYGDGGSLYVSQLKKKFNLAKLEEEEKPILNRLALHAHKLSFNKADGQTISVEAPLPKDMRASLQQLSKWSK